MGDTPETKAPATEPQKQQPSYDPWGWTGMTEKDYENLAQLPAKLTGVFNTVCGLPNKLLNALGTFLHRIAPNYFQPPPAP